jgi:hypothetical protein
VDIDLRAASPEASIRRWRFLLVVVGLAAWASITSAQQSLSQKSKSAAETAQEASRIVTEKNENCRRQARERKLKGQKRLRFIRGCVKK